MFAVPADKHFWEKRCLQGTFYGQKVFVADAESLDSLTILELEWSAGWQTHTCSTWDLTATYLLMELVHAGWATFHIRLLLASLIESSTGFTHVERILREAPFSCEFFQQNYLVIEMSSLQCTRMGEMKQLVDILSTELSWLLTLLSTLVGRLFFTRSHSPLA